MHAGDGYELVGWGTGHAIVASTIAPLACLCVNAALGVTCTGPPTVAIQCDARTWTQQKLQLSEHNGLWDDAQRSN